MYVCMHVSKFSLSLTHSLSLSLSFSLNLSLSLSLSLTHTHTQMAVTRLEHLYPIPAPESHPTSGLGTLAAALAPGPCQLHALQAISAPASHPGPTAPAAERKAPGAGVRTGWESEMSGGSGYGEISGEEGGDGESGACDPVTDASLDGNFRVLRQGLDEVRRGGGREGERGGRAIKGEGEKKGGRDGREGGGEGGRCTSWRVFGVSLDSLTRKGRQCCARATCQGTLLHRYPLAVCVRYMRAS